MFTGLVDTVGTLRGVGPSSAGLELRIECAYRDIAEGESVSVNGACLTARQAGGGELVVAAMMPTLERTAIARWRAGKRVNLERALRLGDRLGGHIVQGHVDCTGRVLQMSRGDDTVLLDVDVAEETWSLLIALGSVAVDGVSLTVNALPSPGFLRVALIEYTLSHTALADLTRGDEVHIEADMIGKYIQRLVAPYSARAG